MKRTRLIVAPIALSVALLAGCQTTGGASANESVAFDNVNCPIGQHAINPELTPASYKGKTIGFCCPDCVKAWAEMSNAERDEYLADMK